MNFSKKVVITILVFLLLFTIACLLITAYTSVEPSTLIMAVFGFCGIECGILGWIKNTDTKNNEKTTDDADLLE